MTYGKKLPCVILLLAAGMAGCIKEREVETPEGKERPVVFAPQVSRGGESRAATGHPIENGATIPVDYHFGVYAWVKPTTVAPVEPFAELQNAKVRHASANEYTYDPVASWPRDADARLACMAYYPWSDQTDPTGNIRVTTGTGTNQTMTINYTVPASSADHVDLMYARTGQTAGYDPVNLDFRHALARLKFEGRTEDFPAGSTVKITGIRVTNAVMKGDLVVLDPATQPGKPPWTLSTSPTDKGTITMPAAHIKDLALTATLQSVITPGGDMLVIPQTVDGLTVEVSASLNGTAFPEPFVFSLTSSPEWTMNEIITYEITLMPDGMHLSANVTDWTTDPVSVIHDGQWWLSVNEDEHRFGAYGDEFTLTAETNYNISLQGYPSGLHVVTEYISGGSGWLTLTNIIGADGDLAREIKIATGKNTVGDRLAKIKIQAGNLTKIVNVTQIYVPPSFPAYPGVIGYDPDRGDLNLEGRGDMVYFKYGGIIGMYAGSNGDIWKTDGSLIAFNPTEISIAAYNSFPIPVKTDYSTIGNVSVFHTLAGIRNGNGDPCRFIKSDGSGMTVTEVKAALDGGGTVPDQGAWRLPTDTENNSVAFSPTQNDWVTQASPSDATLRNGHTFSGLNKGGSHTEGWNFLPATGFRTYSSGIVGHQGTYGNYWSSTLYNATNGPYLYFNVSYVYSSNAIQSTGYAVRCVRQP